MRPLLPTLLLAAALLPQLAAAGPLKPNFLFSDHMVLQREREVPIWGEADPGKKVTVSFNGRTASAQADAEGKWKVKMGPFAVGGPLEMKISADAEAITVKNVMVGDVWFCSGQSNMEWPVLKAKDGKQEVEAANHPKIRLLSIPLKSSSKQLSTLEGVTWAECGPESVKNFAATAYYFGRSMHQHNGVPIGIIASAWGGTSAQTWISLESLETNPDAIGITKEFYGVVNRFDRDFAAGKVDERDAWIDPGLQPKEQGWEKPELDDSKWPTWDLPEYFNRYGKPVYMQGAMWFRRTVDIPAEWAGKEVKLNLGSILNYDIAWFNGVEVGRSNKELFKEKKASGRREYTIPAELVKPGPAVLAVRVFSATGDGGILGYPEWEKRNIELALAEDKKSVVLLKGPWKYAVGHELPHRGVVVDPGSHKLPSSCFNGMVSPVLPYRVKGILWYQGESSTHNAWEYRALFQLLIRSWRQAWAEELPFIYVQLPGVGGESKNPTDDSQYNESWNELRDAQWFGLREPNTAMVAAIDLGEAGIHPSNKQDVGARLAVASRGLVDKEKIEYLGPLYAGIKVEGNKIRVKFTHIGDGLVAKDGAELKRFAIAGADRKYVWAKAVIEGDSVVVSADEVPAPVAVSYAWAMNPVGANLYNSAGLPAAPFRSDDWPMRTHGRKSPY